MNCIQLGAINHQQPAASGTGTGTTSWTVSVQLSRALLYLFTVTQSAHSQPVSTMSQKTLSYNNKCFFYQMSPVYNTFSLPARRIPPLDQCPSASEADARGTPLALLLDGPGTACVNVTFSSATRPLRTLTLLILRHLLRQSNNAVGGFTLELVVSLVCHVLLLKG